MYVSSENSLQISMLAVSFKNFLSLTLFELIGAANYISWLWAESFKPPRVKCDLCLTNLDFGLSLSILKPIEHILYGNALYKYRNYNPASERELLAAR